MSWNIAKTIPSMAVPNLEMGVEYYEHMGFTLAWRWPFIESTHAGMKRGDAMIILSQNDPGARAEVNFLVDDIEACWSTITEQSPWELAEEFGAAANRPDCPPPQALKAPKKPKTRPYGLIEFSVYDPWGHLMTFSQPAKS